MQSPCDPPKFDERDWSKFDFSRWHMDGLNLDETATAIAALSERLLNSPEWRQNFQTALPGLKQQMLTVHQESAKQLQAEKTAVAQDFDQRLADAKGRGDNLARAVEVAAAPPAVSPSPDTYIVGVKIVAAAGRLGLPGLTVQMLDPRDTEAPLVETTTDRDGNAVLALPPETAKQLDGKHTAYQVVGPTGKPLQRFQDSACIRLNQTETKVIAVQESPELQPHKTAAQQNRAERESQVQGIKTKIDLLKQERDSRLNALDCRLKQNQEIINSFQESAPSDASADAPPPPEAPEPPAPAASKGTKGRKKS